MVNRIPQPTRRTVVDVVVAVASVVADVSTIPSAEAAVVVANTADVDVVATVATVGRTTKDLLWRLAKSPSVPVATTEAAAVVVESVENTAVVAEIVVIAVATGIATTAAGVEDPRRPREARMPQPLKKRSQQLRLELRQAQRKVNE